jgi:hypothetical protein
MEGGWFDSEAIEAERMDADIEMAELEARGNSIYRRMKRAKALFVAGDIAAAARACPHQGGYPLRSQAAQNSGDPAFGVSDWVRCNDCGSVLTSFPWNGAATVVEPCSFKPFAERIG